MRIPASTYRVQFNRDFRFSDALAIVEYLHELGITDLYASPILKARPGSTHGYDVIDPSQLNPEIGTPQEFDELCRALQSRGMGLVLDIVPNHMAASADNPWWFDVLDKGQDSPRAAFFDIDWRAGKILLPILGKPYEEALEQRELTLEMENGRPMLRYFGQRLPVSGAVEDFSVEAIDRALSRQHYRLAHWRRAADAINYRRFFDIGDLVALCTERDDVFQETHACVLKFVGEGKVTGLRIDHIDGLRDPKTYLDRLPETYVVTEKILAGNEQLPCDWKTQGTTGYDFLNYANGVFISRQGFNRLERIYADFTGAGRTFAEVFRERKRQVINESFRGELNTLARRLAQLAEDAGGLPADELAADELKEALASATACLPVYRTYIRSQSVSEADRAYIEDAIAAAGCGHAFDFLKRVLLLDDVKDGLQRCLDFVMRWQQFTGPVMAKGLEDTTFYVHNPLVSVNEVGGDCSGPETYFGVEEFHRRNVMRRERWPHTMNTTSTHDSKRSEDVRARINVLSELPNDWARFLRRWKSGTVPAPNEQVLIYQSMLGAWPVEPDRLKQYVTKALREGKTNTSWIDINEDYERRVIEFVDGLYSNETFLKSVERLHRKLAYFGALSSLSQLVLKAASPGVPDFYRGTEVWELSLADPDNRRPVDFARRKTALQKLKKGVDPRRLLRRWSDGRLKMYVSWKLLTFRREHARLFSEGQYIPLRTAGACADHIIAFARRLHEDWCIVAAPRLCASLTRAGVPPIGEKVWKDTRIELPSDLPAQARDIFTDAHVAAREASAFFSALPVALLAAR